MSILVKIIGENDGSDEYAAAEKMKHIINRTVPNTAIGEIVLFPSATLFGQAVKDIDIMMIGNLKNYPVDIVFNHDGAFSKEIVFLESFCTTIEVKAHSITGVKKEATNLYVRYNTGWHNVTKQSNDQKISAMNYFKYILGDSPYITNLIWFVEVSEAELDNILTFRNNIMMSNALPETFEFREVVQKLAYQRLPKKWGGRYIIECLFNGKDADSVAKALQFFSKAKAGMGELTRTKIEQITNTELKEATPCLEGDILNIFRGRAGTGKTIDLIKTAIKLVDEKGARVQILTYNRALVSDIRRLFALAELPDMFAEKCVSINTMQSFFFSLINGCLYGGKLTGEEYLRKYSQVLEMMIEFLKSDPEAKELVKGICEDDPKLNWEYILIDEAQDWSELERTLILLLYEKNKVFVADGGQQFVRSIIPCDWTIVPNKNNIRLKYCLRQKRNLVKFVNAFSGLLDPSRNKIIASENLVGGKVIIIENADRFYQTIKAEKNALQRLGNEAYDLLFIVPPSLVVQNEERCFSLYKEFEHEGLLLWDGTNENNRLEYSIDIEQSRVLQYESVRGLEGWTVCCMNYDEYMDIKEQQFIPDTKGSALFLESIEDKKKRYLVNWALIPLTRAIDTLIITLKNSDSKYSRMMLQLAKKYPDYVQVI